MTKPSDEQPAFDPLLTTPMVAAELNVSLPTIWRWRKAGKFPDPVNLPGNPRWRRSTIEKLKGVPHEQ
ncbi:helix-turn-helix transcriptional regulator [Methylocystis hirsuta]|nr:helix-turn-helix domain-containing protein [Methylocystis hirsuta]